MKRKFKETEEEKKIRLALYEKYGISSIYGDMMGGWKPGVLVKDVPNRIGVEYKVGDEILINHVPNGICFHLKNNLHVSLRPDEYKPI